MEGRQPGAAVPHEMFAEVPDFWFQVQRQPHLQPWETINRGAAAGQLNIGKQ
jgi:hypothetical protein